MGFLRQRLGDPVIPSICTRSENRDGRGVLEYGWVNRVEAKGYELARSVTGEPSATKVAVSLVAHEQRKGLFPRLAIIERQLCIFGSVPNAGRHVSTVWA